MCKYLITVRAKLYLKANSNTTLALTSVSEPFLYLFEVKCKFYIHSNNKTNGSSAYNTTPI